MAAHANGTIGALLKATFGNAPELLISTAALRSGFYRETQLAMLGSMVTNLLFVFGLRVLWEVHDGKYKNCGLRQCIGWDAAAAMAGSLLPAALILSEQLSQEGDEEKSARDLSSQEELALPRLNLAVMIVLYVLFDLSTRHSQGRV